MEQGGVLLRAGRESEAIHLREVLRVEGLQTVGSGLLTLGLVAVAVVLSFYQRLDLEKDIGIAVVRSFVQLAAIGYVINYVFGLENLAAVALLLAGMVLFAAWTTARRASGVPRSFLVAAVATLGALLLLQIVPPTARYLIPLGGMVIGNSMNTASLTLTRIRDDVAEQRLKVEAALSLGANSRQAASPILRTALQRALIPLIDATKTTGIIFLPGAMVGMIIAGADPLVAVRLQIVVLYMLLGSVSIAAILVGLLSYRSFFTARHQLRTTPLDGCALVPLAGTPVVFRIRGRRPEIPVEFQLLYYLAGALLGRLLGGLEDEVGGSGRLVGVGYSGKALDLPRKRLLVETLHVPFCAHLQGCVNEDLHEVYDPPPYLVARLLVR